MGSKVVSHSVLSGPQDLYLLLLYIEHVGFILMVMK